MKPRTERRAWQTREAVLEKALRRRGALADLQRHDSASNLDKVMRRRLVDDGATELPREPDVVATPIDDEPTLPHRHIAPPSGLRGLVARLRRRSGTESVIDQALQRRAAADGSSEPPRRRTATAETLEDQRALQRFEDEGGSVAPEASVEPRWKRIAAGVAFGALAYGAAALGTLTMRGPGAPNKRWFRSLNKPAFQPPDWLFAPVWTALYGTIAYSGYRIWRSPASRQRTKALALWGTQLALNAAWTPLFFGARKPAIALADLVALDAAATSYAIAAAKVDRNATKAVVPYLSWITFATLLNGSIVVKNR